MALIRSISIIDQKKKSGKTIGSSDHLYYLTHDHTIFFFLLIYRGILAYYHKSLANV